MRFCFQIIELAGGDGEKKEGGGAGGDDEEDPEVKWND